MLTKVQEAQVRCLTFRLLRKMFVSTFDKNENLLPLILAASNDKNEAIYNQNLSFLREIIEMFPPNLVLPKSLATPMKILMNLFSNISLATFPTVESAFTSCACLCYEELSGIASKDVLSDVELFHQLEPFICEKWLHFGYKRRKIATSRENDLVWTNLKENVVVASRFLDLIVDQAFQGVDDADRHSLSISLSLLIDSSLRNLNVNNDNIFQWFLQQAFKRRKFFHCYNLCHTFIKL